MISSHLHPRNFESGLTLDGNCAFSVSADRVLVGVDAIRNLRAADNLSGSLAVELWAMMQPLDHLEPEGVQGAQRLAATTIGEIRGQHFVPDCRYDLLFDQPAPGTWQISLLLREWNGHGYTTSDAVNFPVPYVVEVSAGSGTVDAGLHRAVSAPQESEMADSQATAPEEDKSKDRSKAKAKAKAKADKAGEAPADRVSINTATLETIAILKGVSPKVAKAIVAGRPYAEFKDLLAVKGVGEKLLRALRPMINL